MLRDKFRYRLAIFLQVTLVQTVYLQRLDRSFLGHASNGRLSVFLSSDTADSKIVCCSKCMANPSCSSISYNGDTRECLLSEIIYFDVNGNFEIDSVWSTYSVKTEVLVFRAVSGMGMTVESWLQGIPENLNDPACANSGERSCSFFRHHLVNSWGSFSTAHLRIKYALHKDPNEQEVAYITFNGSGSATLEDWFTADRIIGSSWSDLTLSTTFLDFVIKGTWIGHERWFRALTSAGWCAADGGYTLVVTGQGIYSCSYDYHDSYPQFYFSINTGPCYFDTYDFAQADAMTILIYVE